MKNAIVGTLTRLVKPFVVTLLVFSLITSVSAQPIDKIKETPFEVKYLGSIAGKPMFQISFSNPQGDDVQVTLRDENGYTIFTDVSKEKTYSKKLQFNDLDTDKLKLTLTLRTKKDSQTQAFEITKSTRTVEDVAVVAL